MSVNAATRKKLDEWTRRGIELEALGLEPGIIGDPERIKRRLRNAEEVAKVQRRRARKA